MTQLRAATDPTKARAHFVYMNDDGSVRDITATEAEYLATAFDGADGNRPYIKRHHDMRTPDGKLRGFLRRSDLPARDKRGSQLRSPCGWIGRLTLWRMNKSHSRLTDWGLSHVAVGRNWTMLDVGCGGGRTVAKLAALASNGKVFGIDHSDESVAAARRANHEVIATGRVEIGNASVSELPFENGTFDLVTAVETHFWWGDIGAGMREIRRVLKPGGRLLIVAEFYNGGKHVKYVERVRKWMTMAALTADEHRALFTDAGFASVEVIEEPGKGWICCLGRTTAADGG